jgi:hypothetical protein
MYVDSICFCFLSLTPSEIRSRISYAPLTGIHSPEFCYGNTVRCFLWQLRIMMTCASKTMMVDVGSIVFEKNEKWRKLGEIVETLFF